MTDFQWVPTNYNLGSANLEANHTIRYKVYLKCIPHLLNLRCLQDSFLQNYLLQKIKSGNNLGFGEFQKITRYFEWTIFLIVRFLST